MTTYDENKVQLVVNRMDNTCYNALSSKSNDEIYIVSSNPSGVVKIDLDAVDMVQASVSTMGSSIDAIGSSISALGNSVSALASSMSNKRDYLDLTYTYSSTSTSTVTVTVPFCASNMIGSTASETNAYRSGITLVLDDGAGDPLTGTYIPGQTEQDGYWKFEYDGGYYTVCWEDFDGVKQFVAEGMSVGKPDDGDTSWTGYDDPETPTFTLTLTMPTVTTSTRPFYSASMSSSEYRQGLVINYQGSDHSYDGYDWGDYYGLHVAWGDFDGTNQFGMGSVPIGCPPDGQIYNWTTTYSGEPTYTPIPITLKLPSMTSTVTVSDTIALQGTVNASVSALGSSITAIASSLNVSGIGCSTITMSGVYSNSSSFSFDVVIQPTA